MSANSLENEDLDNVPLVRMEDIQPRGKVVISNDNLGAGSIVKQEENNVYETVIEDLHYESECMLDDDSDSNIGSMVSIKCDGGDNVSDSECDTELIVPDVLDQSLFKTVSVDVETKGEIKISPPDRWPTLEILPGGVIKNGDKIDDDSSLFTDRAQEHPAHTNEMMFACAKCSQTFKYLFCLVKHVKWHEDQKKVVKEYKIGKLSTTNTIKNEYICLHSNKKKLVDSRRVLNVKTSRRKGPKRLT